MEEVFRDSPDTVVPAADEIATDEKWQEIEQSPARFEELRRAFGLHPKDGWYRAEPGACCDATYPTVRVPYAASGTV